MQLLTFFEASKLDDVPRAEDDVLARLPVPQLWPTLATAIVQLVAAVRQREAREARSARDSALAYRQRGHSRGTGGSSGFYSYAGR